MYNPVTAQFLQADAYLGNLNDPLSLNLYTYCLNNPHRYTDPSGHMAITAAAVFLAVRIGISLFSGFMSAKAEYDRQEAEGDNYTDWGSVLFVGAANAGVSFATFGIGSGAVKGAGVGAKLLLKQLGKAVVRDVAIGAVTDAGIEAARQLATGTKVTNLEYDRITEAGVLGGIVGGGSTVAGAALEALANTRVVRNAAAKAVRAADRGGNAIKRGFAKLASANGKVTTEEVEENAVEVLAKESKIKLDYVTSNGLQLESTPGHTTTVLGTYRSDTEAILEELGNVKSLDFGPRNGGFNLLNTPDELYISPEQFWTEYNKPWLDNVIARNDIIMIATEPVWDNLTRVNKLTGKMELTGFGREYTYLKKHGYYFDSVTKSMIR